MVRGFVLVAGLSLLLLPAGAQQKTVFRSAVQTVVLHATVRSPDGRLVPDLEQDAFEVRDEGQPVEITFFSNDPQPITVALLLDMSASMVRNFLRVRESTMQFVDALHPEDRARIGTFGIEVGLSPWLTGDKRILHRIVREELWPGGSTPLWEAVHAAMDSLEEETGRRIIVTLSDGVDAGSIPGMEGSSGKARERAENDGFMVYAIGVEGAPLDDAITSIAERTGGGYFKLEAGADLSATFVRVVEELRHQYVLGFSPPKADGKLHEVEVRIKRPGMSVRARKNYRAPGRR